MSRIGRRPIPLPLGVTVTVEARHVQVRGPKGELSLGLLPGVTVQVEEGKATVDAGVGHRALHGLTRALLANMVLGVTTGYEQRLELVGVGYKAQIQGKVLVLNVGFSHPVEFFLVPDVDVTQDEKNKNILILRGMEKQRVGQIAAAIRAIRPPEPYKGKGIRYVGESVRRKVGKAAVAKATV